MKHNEEIEKIRDEVLTKCALKKEQIMKKLNTNSWEHALVWGVEDVLYHEMYANTVFWLTTAVLQKPTLEEQIEFCNIYRQNATKDLHCALQNTSVNSNEMHNIAQRISFSVRGTFLSCTGGEYSLQHVERILEKALQEKQKEVL